MAVEHIKTIWSLETLFEYFTDLSKERERRTDERFAASKEATTLALAAAKEGTQLAMAASEKAIAKAEAAADKRAEASNEIRAAMVDQQKNFADKVQTDFRLVAIEKRLDGTEGSILTIGGRTQGIGVSTGVIFQVLTLVISVFAVVLVLLRHN
jgi:hypothetical protein